MSDEKPKKKSITVSHDDDQDKSQASASKEIKLNSRSLLKPKDEEAPEAAGLPTKAKDKDKIATTATVKPLTKDVEKSEPESDPGPDPVEPKISPPKTSAVDSKPEVKDSAVDEPADVAAETAPDKPVEATDSIPADAQSDETTPDQPTKEQQLEAAKEIEHEAAIHKLAESRKYALPINSVEKRRTKRSLILGIVISLVLILAWFNIALDAGLININGIEPLTSFF